MPDLRLEGRLEESNFAKLMYSICRTGETGTLYLSRGKVMASVHIAKGQVVFASSNDLNDRLGELLLRHGQISLAQYEEASSKIQPGKRLGAVLVELGHLKAQELYHYVIEQVKEIIFNLFAWQEEGTYRFEIGSESFKEIITLNINTTDLILEGIKRISQWSRIQEAVGKLDAVYELIPGWEERMKGVALTQGEQRLLDSVREHRTLARILENTKFSDFEACRLLWAFQILGLVNQRDAMEAEVGDLLGEALTEEKEDKTVRLSAAPARGFPSPVKKPLYKPAAKAAPAVPPKPAAPPAPAQALKAKDKEDDFEIELVEDAPAKKSADEGAAPDSLPAKEIESAVMRFNEKHDYLYALLKVEVPDSIAVFVDDALGSLDRHHLRIFDGVKADANGAFPKEALIKNIRGNALKDYQAGLDALLNAELEAAKKVFKNPARLLVVKKGLKRFDEKESE